MKKITYLLLSIVYLSYNVFGIQGFAFAKSDYTYINNIYDSINYSDYDQNQDIYDQVENIISSYKISDDRLDFFGIWKIYAQSIDSVVIRKKITDVLNKVDGKVTAEAKNSILVIITNKIKTISDPIMLDIWVYFLRGVKNLRVVWEIIEINTSIPSNTDITTKPSNTSSFSNVDFVVDFASFTISPNIWQKFATIKVKIKNIWDTYVPSSDTMLKFGCKGIDWNYYAYWSYNNYQNIYKNWEIIFEIPSVTISNLTSSPGYKILNCKVNPDSISPESNYENNTVSIPFVLQ